MIVRNFIRLIAFCFVISLFATSCNTPPAESAAKTDAPAAENVAAKPDMVAVKTEIQTLESAWAKADDARDLNGILAFYSDDAKSLPNNEAILMGKPAIQKNYETHLAKRDKGSTVAYDVIEVYGNENTVTEIGTTTRKDATGKVVSTGKYMAVWEKRDGKYLCVSDISNDDVKEK